MRPNLRFIAIVLLLGAAAGFLQARPSEELPAREPLSNLSIRIGQWQGVDDPISPTVLQVLGKGDFLQRSYLKPSASEPIQLFIAYFPSQRTGATIHSPQNCLPGSGWSPLESNRAFIPVRGYAPLPVNRYVIAKGDERQLVMYWYWSHDRAVASEYQAKLYLIEDAIRLHRSDGALIRLSTTLHTGESSSDAQNRLADFAQNLVPQLDPYIPR